MLGLTLLWVYLRRNESFLRFRNTILTANLIGLAGYALMPTAPPRMLPELGFVDTLALFSSVNHSSGAVEAASNPYAAMPSLHAADALIVGVVMALIVRRPIFKALWLAWPVWVWFAVMATANHWWLDIAAGVAVAGVAWGLLELWERRRRPQHAHRVRAGAVKEGYEQGARRLATRSITGLARTRVTPNALTAVGVTLCRRSPRCSSTSSTATRSSSSGSAPSSSSSARCWTSWTARSRATAGAAPTFGAFIDSTTDRIGEAAVLGAIVLVLMRDGNEVGVALTIAALAGGMLVPYARARAEALGPQGRGRLRRPRRARGDHRRLARARALGRAAVGMALLALAAWSTVLQRILLVRTQLRAQARKT